MIIYYSLVALGTAILCLGVAKFMATPFTLLVFSSAAQLNILVDSAIDEKKKDIMVLKNLASILKWFFLNIILLAFLVVLGILPAAVYSHFTKNFEPDITSWWFFLSMVIGSIPVLFIKKTGDYSYWSKLLHVLILDNYALGKYLLKRELKKRKIKSESDPKFVIVSGLARGGTTALTNLIYDDSRFHSIKYSHVPFLLAPNLWRKVHKSKRKKVRERAHGDKVTFHEGSIEALEEYFFKSHLLDSYIGDSQLNKHEVSNELLKKYYQYQGLFQEKDKTIYLAKNNNFILRYPSIAKQNDQFKMLLLFRAPLAHAKSLLRQHQNFKSQQSKDPFVLQYMNWLGHHEFGLNQKEFNLSEKTNQVVNQNKDELGYWINIWCNYYRYVLEIYEEGKNIMLIDYQDLLQHPDQLKKVIGNQLSIELNNDKTEPFEPPNRQEEPVQESVQPALTKADQIHQELIARKIVVEQN